MANDGNADERYALGRQIVARERRVEEIGAERRRIAAMWDRYDIEMWASFERSRELSEEQAAHGGAGLRRDRMDEDAEFQRSVRDMIRGQREDTDAVYATALADTQREVEDLQRRRDGLPWG